MGKLTASDGGGLFGWSVDIGGDKIAVGAPGNFFFTGSAYLFYRNKNGQNAWGDTWGEVKRINASDPWLLNQFGWALSLSGDFLAVGAPFHDNDRGAAYIFARNQGDADNWGQMQKKMAYDAEAGDHFGHALSLSGGQLAVGAPDEDSQGASSGAVYIFYRNYGSTPDNWGQARKVLALDGTAGNAFGWAVASECDRVLASSGVSGAVHVLERNAGGADQWGFIQKLTTVDAAIHFGFSLDMSGNNFAMGADNSAYLFQRRIVAEHTAKTMPWLMLLLQ